MNICLLAQYYKPETGAAPNRLFEMMDGLKKCGNNVCVVTAMPNYPTGRIFDAYKGKVTCTEELDGIEIRRYWIYASNSRKAIPRILGMLSFSFTALFSLKYLKSKQLDYLIVGSPPLTLGVAALHLAKRCKCKLVANISDIWPLTAKEMGAISDGFVYHCLERCERQIYEKAHITMGQSQEIIDHISSHGSRKSYLFRNGVDPTRFDGLDGIHPEEGKFKLIYAGLLGYAQGILDICKSVNFQESGIEFHIYGSGGEQKDIEEYLQQNPDNGIFYHGTVPAKELPIKLKEANMALVPLIKNIYGAVPSKIYESMAAGLPILFVGEGEGAHLVKDNGVGLVAHAKDYEGLKSNIQFAVTHPQELKIMAENGRMCANTKFNRPKQVVELNRFLADNLQ